MSASLLDEDITPEPSSERENTPSNGHLVNKLKVLKSKNTTSLTQAEALKLAIEAAELQIQFVKLAESKAQQQEQMQRSRQLLTQAERIKKSPTWDPANGEDLLDLNPLEPPKAASPTTSVTDTKETLTELQNCRELTTHEELIQWRGSTLNHSSARPWDHEKGIKSEEFILQEGQNQYQ